MNGETVLLILYILCFVANTVNGSDGMAKNVYIYYSENKERPEVDKVILKDEQRQELMDQTTIRDIYKSDYMSSGVVGLVGAPFRVSYDGKLDSPLLTFHYLKDELRGVPEENLIILHQDEDSGMYLQVDEETLDQEHSMLSVHIEEPGVYLMADKYTWYSAWGDDMSAYAYTVDPTEFESDWERECDTGSILEIADKEWAIKNAPIFFVSTPEQLAGVVYYVNAVKEQGEKICIYLEDDIKLDGYSWVPMGWGGASSHSFEGEINGQGHAIWNMDIHIPYDNHCAFVGYSTGLLVRNISFHNAEISGGRYTGIVGGEIYISKNWENIHVDGVIQNATGEVGSIVGREAYLNFKDCTSNVVYVDESGNRSPLSYFSHRQEVLANTPATEDFLLTLNEDGSITRTEKLGFQNLGWVVEVDGCQLLDRLASREYTFTPTDYVTIPEGSHCEIYLNAFTGETYTRVSNVIEYPTEYTSENN